MLRVFHELMLWWEAFCLNAPGEIGYKLRSRLFAKRTRNASRNVLVGPGVFVRGWNNLHYIDHLNIGNACIVETSFGEINIGNNVSLNSGVVLSANNGRIDIGNDVLIGMNTVFRAAGHRFDQSPRVPIVDQGHVDGKIVVGNDVWIGANVTILPNSCIENHCVIGAGAVVSGTIPQGTVSVGVPAKVVKSLGNI